ncbi:MAG: hypothetical protein IJQ82_05340 [Selenomonadaceae bacterium]|nr:hypothetical protein [Selenomonadaceae bacterium]
MSFGGVFLFPNVAQDVPPPVTATEIPTSEPKVAPVDKIPSTEPAKNFEQTLPDDMTAEEKTELPWN